jgi:hypothetical protein
LGTVDPVPTPKRAPAASSLWEWQRSGKIMSPEQFSTLEAWAKQGALVRADKFRPNGTGDWRSLAEVPELAVLAGVQVQSPGTKPKRTVSFEHTTAVFRFKTKGYAESRADLLEGIDEASASVLEGMGAEGWEMVSVVPFSSGGASLSFTGSLAKTDAVLAFFKRMVV